MCEFTHGSGKHIITAAEMPCNVVRLGSPMFYSIGLPFYHFLTTQQYERLVFDYGNEKSSNHHGKRQRSARRRESILRI